MITEASNTQPDQPEMTAKPRRIRRWNDRAYKKFVNACAQELGISINALYNRAGVDPSNHSRDASENGRSIEQILAIADAAGKDPLLFITAGTIGQNIAGCEEEAAKLAFSVAAHLYSALSQPIRLPWTDARKMLLAVLSATKTND